MDGERKESVLVSYLDVIYIYIYIYMVGRSLTSLAKELTAATIKMQSSSTELSTLLSDSAKCKQTIANPKWGSV